MEKERKVVWLSYHIDNFNKSEKEEYLDTLDEEDEEEALMAEEIRNAPKLVTTPYGLIELDDSQNIFNNLDFWLIRTNFNITDKCFTIANYQDGVEACKVVSRYALLVGFPKNELGLFDHSAIKTELGEKLLNIEAYDEELYKKQHYQLFHA